MTAVPLATTTSAGGKDLVTHYDDSLEVDPIMEEFWGMTRSKDGLWEVKDQYGLPVFGYRVREEPSMRRLKELHKEGYYDLVYDLKHDGTEYFFRGGDKIIAKAVRMDMKDGRPTTDPD